MSYITREQFLAAVQDEAQDFDSEVFKGKLKFRFARVADKAFARKHATRDNQLDSEAFECAIVGRCLLEPKLSEMDIVEIKKLNAAEINRLASAILSSGKVSNGGEKNDPLV